MTTTRWTLLLGLLAGCDDTLFPAKHTGTGTTTATEGWCAVQGIFRSSCLSCHSAASALGGLDLETDPHGALVGVSSAAYGAVLVSPGDPEGSLLLSKMEDTQGAAGGGVMPPTGALPTDRTGIVRAWIADGASDVCATEPTTPTGGGYHPPGWADPASHGLQAKLNAGLDLNGSDCRTCHGDTLSGELGLGPSCASCHPADWQTDCTFCHGSAGDPAPPEDIDDNDDPAAISFVPHRKHLGEGKLHPPDWDCTSCHVVPVDALAPGHLFDDPTPGVADVDFTSGASPDGVYQGAASCSNLYCHGNGRIVGSVDAAATPTVSCASCHPPAGLAGRHEAHLDEGIACAECHPTALDSTEIDRPELHVNGSLELELPATIDVTGAGPTCTGACHQEPHNASRW